MGMFLQLGAGMCGALLCSSPSSAWCCPSQTATPEHPPEHTVQRAPCGACCDTQDSCRTAPTGPALEAALARVPGPPPAALAIQPAAPYAAAGQRPAAASWQARPPPALPSPTATIVLLI